VAAAVLLAGCSGRPAADPGPPGAGPVTTVSDDGDVPGRVIVPSAAIVTAMAEREREAPVLGAVVGGDGTTVELYVLPLGRTPARAGDLQAEVEAGASGVAVRVVRRAAPASGAATAEPVCRLSRDVHVIRVSLDEPLGARVLVDRSSGVTLEPVAAGAILRPAAVPAGWTLLDEGPWREGDRQTGWIQRYGPDPDRPLWTLAQRRAELGPSERFVAGRRDVTAVAVRGVTATWSRQADGRAGALVWQEDGWEVSVDAVAIDDRTGPEPDAVVAFAAGLRRPDRA